MVPPQGEEILEDHTGGIRCWSGNTLQQGQLLRKLITHLHPRERKGLPIGHLQHQFHLIPGEDSVGAEGVSELESEEGVAGPKARDAGQQQQKDGDQQ